jgi:hypothetical protein
MPLVANATTAALITGISRPTNLCLDKRGPTVTMPCMHAVVEPQPLPAGCSRQCGELGMEPVAAVGQWEAGP